MCLVNDAVYIAKYADGEHELELSTGEKIMTPWTATGAEFQHPYILKTLFARYPLKFRDYCETKSVAKGALYLDMNEGLNEDEHMYKFIGRVGEFCPIQPGKGGGILYRVADDKYYAAAGTKGYRWLDAETVKEQSKENCIDIEYFNTLANKAMDHIKEFGDFEWFVSDDKEFPNDIKDDNREEVPFEEDFKAMNPPIENERR
jgi:hypothetical protein